MTSNRIVARFNDDHMQTLQTLLANTYGHTIPLKIQTIQEQQPSLVLKVDDSIPEHLVEQAKQICLDGCKRYHNR